MSVTTPSPIIYATDIQRELNEHYYENTKETKCTCNGWKYKELKPNELLCVNCGAIEDYKPMFKT